MLETSKLLILTHFVQLISNICFCCDINGLLQELGCRYYPKEWGLFIDSNKTSPKAVLLHDGNEKPSIAVPHATVLSEAPNP